MWKLLPFSIFLSAAFLHLLSTFLPSSPEPTPPCWGKLRAPRGENTIFLSCKGIIVIAAIKDHAQSVTRVGIKVRLIPEEARHLSASHSQDFHWKNLCCVFIIARSMYDSWCLRNEGISLDLELFCFLESISLYWKPVNYKSFLVHMGHILWYKWIVFSRWCYNEQLIYSQ